VTQPIEYSGAGLWPCAFILSGLTAVFLAVCLLPPVALARQTINIDSAAWCARSTPKASAQCLQMESACRAALPDLAPAGGCPDRQLDRCIAQQNDKGSWCAILCCLEPDHPACRTAATTMPDILTPSER